MKRQWMVADVKVRCHDCASAGILPESPFSRITVVRQILEDGVAVRKCAMALRTYAGGKVSKSRAAEMAGISLWEMHDLIQREGVREPVTLEEALAEVRKLVTQLGKG